MRSFAWHGYCIYGGASWRLRHQRTERPCTLPPQRGFLVVAAVKMDASNSLTQGHWNRGSFSKACSFGATKVRNESCRCTPRVSLLLKRRSAHLDGLTTRTLSRSTLLATHAMQLAARNHHQASPRCYGSAMSLLSPSVAARLLLRSNNGRGSVSTTRASQRRNAPSAAQALRARARSGSHALVRCPTHPLTHAGPHEACPAAHGRRAGPLAGNLPACCLVR